MGNFIRTFITIGMLASTAAFAVDYDFEAAKRVWDDRRQELNSAQATLDRETNALVPLQQRVDQRTTQVNLAEARLQDLRTEQTSSQSELTTKRGQLTTETARRRDLTRDINEREDALSDMQRRRDNLEGEVRSLREAVRQLDFLIRELENRPGDGPWTCVYVDSGWEEHSGGHRSTNNDRAAAADAAEAACLAVHGSCELSDCAQPDSAELRRARADREDVQRDLDAKVRELDRAEADYREIRDDLEDLRDDLDDAEDAITTLNQRITWLENRIASLQSQISSAVQELDEARDDLNVARASRDGQRVVVASARTARDAAASRERDASAYYQTVLGNYNTGLAEATSHGRSDAEGDSGREGAERATASGTADGNSRGAAAGTAEGLADSVQVAAARGYNFGLAQGRTDPRLSTAYQNGLAAGASVAEGKAAAEDFPTSYNSRLNEVFAVPPTHAASYDITTELPEVPGRSGPLQDATPRPIGSLDAPADANHAEPAVEVPAVDSPNVIVPAADRRYYAPDCGGEPIQAFVRACTDAYAANYVSGYQTGYRRQYLAKYAQAFRSAAAPAYATARATQHQDTYDAQAALGGRDVGVLDGFSRTLSAARTRAAQSGRQAVEELRGRGILPVLRVASLEQAVDDGVFSPGEAVKLSVVLDNYGLLNAAEGSLRIRLIDLENLGFSLVIRALPAVAADSRVTLTGVLTGATAQTAGRVMKLRAILETSAGSPVDEAVFQDGIRLPLELSDVTFPGPLRIGAVANATLKIKNNTNASLEAVDAPFSLVGEGLTSAVRSVRIPEIGAGQIADVTVAVTPTAYANPNSLVSFELAPGAIGGGAAVTISKSIGITVSRSGVLELCLPTCGAPVNMPLRVRAGQAFSLPMQFRFTGTQAQNFDFGKLATSNSGISNAEGTFRVGPGQWGPQSAPYPVTFAYNVSAALRGTTQWISLDVKANGTQIQVVKLPLVID